MESIIKVVPVGISKLNNSEYAFFMERCIELIREAEAENIGVSESDVTDFAAQVSLLSSVLKSTKASDETQKLRELDAKRNNILSTLFAAIRSARTSSNEAKNEAGNSLCLVIKPFMSIKRQPLKQKSQQIVSLNEHLSTSENAGYITVLDLQEELTSLVSFNDEYINLYTKRLDEREATSCLPHREACDEYYNLIKIKAEGSANISQTAQAISFVTKLNKLIDPD
ncbi:MAG: DUF6261 family protein [Spirochaetales bacterium]